MKVGYLYKDTQERFNLKRSWRVNAWRIVDEQGKDMVQPWFNTKAELFAMAKKIGIRISRVIVQVKGWNTYVILREGCRVKNESDLFNQIKLELQHQGYDCIKRIPDRDGHMTSAPYYIRARDKSWCILDARHEIRDAGKEINEHGSIILRNYWAIPVPKEGNNDQHHGSPVTEVGERQGGADSGLHVSA